MKSEHLFDYVVTIKFSIDGNIYNLGRALQMMQQWRIKWKLERPCGKMTHELCVENNLCTKRGLKGSVSKDR